MKKLLLVICVLLGISTLTGCNEQPLDERFDADTLEQTTLSIVENLNSQNYDTIESLVRDDLQDILSSSVIQKAWEPIKDKLGEYEGKSVCVIKSNGDNVTVAMVSNYEKGKLQVTANYNLDMKLIGLYIK